MGRGLDELSAFATMDEAVALGITLFDTAERYAGGASEIMIGRWLIERDSPVTDRVRLATKVAPPYVDGSGGRFDAAFLEERFSGSLQRLGVDTVEFLLTHAPDDATPIEETLEGLEAIRASGRCRYVGASNIDAGQLTAALDAAERLGISGYQVVQNAYSLLGPQDDRAVRSICAERDLAFTPFSPLAGGALTAKYERHVTPPPDSRMALRPDGVDELLTPAVYDAIDRLRSEAERRHGVRMRSPRSRMAVAPSRGDRCCHRSRSWIATPRTGCKSLRRCSVGCGIRRDRILVRVGGRQPVAERIRRTFSGSTGIAGALGLGWKHRTEQPRLCLIHPLHRAGDVTQHRISVRSTARATPGFWFQLILVHRPPAFEDISDRSERESLRPPPTVE